MCIASCMATDQRTGVRKGSAMGGHEHESGGSDTDLMLIELVYNPASRDRKNPFTFRPCSRHPSREVNNILSA